MYVDAVVYYRVQNAIMAVVNVTNADTATQLLAQATLRNVLSTKSLAEILSDREDIAQFMQVKSFRCALRCSYYLKIYQFVHSFGDLI